MTQCVRCGLFKPSTNFRPVGNGYRKRYCKKCDIRYQENKRRSRQKNRKPRRVGLSPREQVKQTHKKTKAFNRAIKSGPCTDCGHTFHPEVMEWDHVRGDKVRDCGEIRTIPALLREVAKCELVCANCHRLRTVRRRATQEATPPKAGPATAEQLELGWDRAS